MTLFLTLYPNQIQLLTASNKNFPIYYINISEIFEKNLSYQISFEQFYSVGAAFDFESHDQGFDSGSSSYSPNKSKRHESPLDEKHNSSGRCSGSAPNRFIHTVNFGYSDPFFKRAVLHFWEVQTSKYIDSSKLKSFAVLKKY